MLILNANLIKLINPVSGRRRTININIEFTF